MEYRYSRQVQCMIDASLFQDRLNWPSCVLDRSTVADATSNEIYPMTFDLVNVNQGSLYSNGIVRISTSGYYYMYISAGAAQRQVSICRPRVRNVIT